MRNTIKPRFFHQQGVIYLLLENLNRTHPIKIHLYTHLYVWMFYKQFHNRFTWKIRGFESKLIQSCPILCFIICNNNHRAQRNVCVKRIYQTSRKDLLYWKHLQKYWMLPCLYSLYINCIHVHWQTHGVEPPFSFFLCDHFFVFFELEAPF